MSSGFGELTRQAHELVAAGDLGRARELLGAALAGADPNPQHASPELTEAAGLQARVLVALGEPHTARGWAAFGYSAATRLYGPSDQHTVAAAATLAAVLHRVGSHARAARLYRDVIIELTATDGPESLRVLAAHADLATVEYARGECEPARNRLADAWELHREIYGDGHPGGIRMLARLGAMQRDCGLRTQAHEHLALAQELCRQHLPADHPLAAQIAALARAAASPDHACAARPADAGSAEAPTSRGGGPAEPGPEPGHPRSPVPPPPGFPPPAPPYGHPSGPENFVPAGFPPAGSPRPAGFSPPPATPQVPPPRLPPAPPVDSAPRWAVPRHGHPARPTVPPPRTSTDRSRAGSDAGAEAGPGGSDEDLDPDDRWWPPEIAEPDPDGPDRAAGGRYAGPALPPSVPSLAAGGGAYRELPPGLSDDGAGDEADGVRRVRHLPEPRRPARLPARIHRLPPPATRRMLPVVVAGLAVVLLGTAAVVAGFALAADPEPRPPGTRTGTPTGTPTGPTAGPPSTPPPASPGTPPGTVTLTDGRESVTLAWTYPLGAEGPVVISGGRTGQETRAFQELPAGSTSYVVYGLDSRTNYCFSVSVVYSANVVGRASPVCTGRAGASPAR